LNRGAAIAFGEKAPDLDEATNVICRIGHGQRRSLPEFALRKSQRVKLGLSALNPFFETVALIGRHFVRQAGA